MLTSCSASYCLLSPPQRPFFLQVPISITCHLFFQKFLPQWGLLGSLFFFHFACFLILLEYSCFTMWCRFLSCLNMFQFTYIYPSLYLFLLLNGKPMLLMHGEAKQYWNSGVWNRDWFITGPSRRWVVHAVRTPRLLRAFCKAVFKQKVREGCG